MPQALLKLRWTTSTLLPSRTKAVTSSWRQASWRGMIYPLDVHADCLWKHASLSGSQTCHPRGLQLMAHSSPKWACTACGSLGCTFGLFQRRVQHRLVLTHKRPLPIPWPFQRHIPQKYQSSPITSLPLFCLLYGVFNFSHLSYTFPCPDTKTISKVIFSDADCLDKGPCHDSPAFSLPYSLFFQIPLTYAAALSFRD